MEYRKEVIMDGYSHEVVISGEAEEVIKVLEFVEGREELGGRPVDEAVERLVDEIRGGNAKVVECLVDEIRGGNTKRA